MSRIDDVTLKRKEKKSVNMGDTRLLPLLLLLSGDLVR